MSNALPTAEQAREACAFMAAEVHTPAFFEKLAAHGIEPQTEQEAQQLLQLGAMLQQAEVESQTKQASENAGNPFLTYVMQRLSPQAAPQELIDNHIKAAADQAVQVNPLAKSAALLFGHVVGGGEVIETAAAEQPAAE